MQITITANTNRFWVGGTGDWSSETHWSNTSGGPSGASPPDLQRQAFVDANSGSGNYSIRVDQAASVANIDFSGAATPTLADGSGGPYGLTISNVVTGSLSKLVSGMGFTYTGTTTINGTAMDFYSGGTDLSSTPLVLGNVFLNTINVAVKDSNGIFGPITTPTNSPTETPTAEMTATLTPTPSVTQTRPPTRTFTPTGTPNSGLEIDRSVATTVFASTQFLYTIEPRRAAVVRGHVAGRDPITGNLYDLADVAVTILNHPEFGTTLTQSDGYFDMAVNGGGALVVDYQKADYLPVQRQIDVPWNDYALPEDVVMIQLDEQVTTVDLTENIDHVARGTEVTDADGVRAATVFIPAGTQAYLAGSSEPLDTLSIHATEYTVGDSGPQAMPGSLPPNSGYTYAVELSVNEAGSDTVEFSQPVFFYVENFLNFSAGAVSTNICSETDPDFSAAGVVPVGYYDRERGVWVPSDNGQIVQIVDIDSETQQANVDTDGDGVADNGLGITGGERTELAALYEPGQSLWRVPMTHFSIYDLNWGFGPPFDALPPQLQKLLRDLGLEDEYRCTFGSRIECENQVLGEVFDITGTPFRLHYQSDRVPGREANTVSIQLSDENLYISDEPANRIIRIDLEVSIAGRRFTESFAPDPNQQIPFHWDGKDAYGRTLQGRQPLRVRVGYVYDGAYQTTSRFGANGNGTIVTGDRTRREITLWQEARGSLGGFDARPFGLGGWTLSVHHAYDVWGQLLRLGNGERRASNRRSGVIRSIAMGDPTGVAVGPDGSVYMAEGHRVRRVAPDGSVTTVAGNGEIVFSGSGDGGPATEAGLVYASGVAVANDGSIYIADWFDNRVRRVDPDGIITTVAGTGASRDSGDCGPGTAAQLNEPYGIAVAADGTLYIADAGNNRVRSLDPNGLITTVAGTGFACDRYTNPEACMTGDGGPATAARILEPNRVAVGPDGSLYISDWWNCRVRRVTPDGIINTVAGNGSDDADGDGGPATAAAIGESFGVAVSNDGSLYITDIAKNLIRKVAPSGIITTVGGKGYISPIPCGGEPDSLNCAAYGDGGPATAAALAYPLDIAAGPDGFVYVVDEDLGRVRALVPPMPGLQSDASVIASDDGTELYVFDGLGRHLYTLNALTGTTRYTFTYDDAGRLTQIADGDDNPPTTIQRDIDGTPTAIVGPYGQPTTLTLDENGYLNSLTNPNGETRSFTYNDDGLMLTMTDPRGMTNPEGHTYTFTYDEDGLGRLTEDADPAGVEDLGAGRCRRWLHCHLEHRLGTHHYP